MLYELSTPFLNVHWFCDKLGMTGSKLQLYNGIALLVTFFGCRIVWGTYSSFLIYSDIYKALTTSTQSMMGPTLDDAKCNGSSNIMEYVGTGCTIGDLPMWLVGVYLVGNTALSCLNFYWFNQMIKAVRKRFTPEAQEELKKAK